MKYLISLFLVTLISTSCGPLAPSEEKNSGQAEPIVVDSQLDVYALRFEKEFNRGTGSISMVFGDPSGNSVGQCTISGPNKKITIKLSYWGNLDDYGKEQLMYHELGHCALGLGHDDTKRSDDNCPISIMNSSTLGACYQSHYYDYLVDFKGRI